MVPVVPIPTDGASDIDPLTALLERRAEFLRFLRRRLRDRHRAEDILQDAFARASVTVHGLRDRDRVVPWFYRTLKNAMIDDHRASRNVESTLADFMRDAAASESETDPLVDDERGVDTELARWLPAFIARLPPRYREALALTELEQMTAARAAKKLGVTVGCVTSRVVRARHRLRRMFEARFELVFDRRGRIVDVAKKIGTASRLTNAKQRRPSAPAMRRSASPV